ncbi:hypothetical protein [Streptomyces luteireticuli]|uniref:hypothetical protein n=1 Tax=Streptomyces luteireticuli TaxID=173858 RepID=UPI003557CA2C
MTAVTEQQPVDLDTIEDIRVTQENRLTPQQIARGLAFHEAAHAVIGMAAGMPLVRTRIVRTTQDGRPVLSGATAWAPNSAQPFDFAVMSLAGQTADLRQLAEAGLLTAQTAAWADSAHDRHLATTGLATIGYEIRPSGPAPAYGTTWAAVADEAERRVTALWPQITAVAQAMLTAANETVTAAEAEALTGIPNPAPYQH